jgi:hypothetical protein
MTQVRKQNVTTVCDNCGAAMVIVRVWPIDEDTDVPMFRCEICSATAFFRSKPPHIVKS